MSSERREVESFVCLDPMRDGEYPQTRRVGSQCDHDLTVTKIVENYEYLGDRFEIYYLVYVNGEELPAQRFYGRHVGEVYYRPANQEGTFDE